MTAETGERNAGRGAEPVTFVLVHGAWHGGWCWDSVAASLRADGHTVHAPTLTGLGERSHLLTPNVGLTTHVEDVLAEIRDNDLTDVVLCGHSYGGMVITGAADQAAERMRSLIYLDAFLPQDGQSIEDITGFSVPPGDTIASRPATNFVSPGDAEWVQPKLTPQPAATFRERLRFVYGGAPGLKRTYIQAMTAPSPFFTATHDALVGNPDWRVERLESRHDVMIDRPTELVALLTSAA